MANNSRPPIPQGLRNNEKNFSAEPMDRIEDNAEDIKASITEMNESPNSNNTDFFRGDHNGNLTQNGDDPDKVPVVPTLSDDEVPNLPGAILKHAREMLGLSQREIAFRLKLRVNTISDIEHDRLTQPTAAPFARGYISDYARLVNIDPKTVVDLYNQNVLETTELARAQARAPQATAKAERKAAAPANNANTATEASSQFDKKKLLMIGGGGIVAFVLIILAVALFMKDAPSNETSGDLSDVVIADNQDGSISLQDAGNMVIDRGDSQVIDPVTEDNGTLNPPLTLEESNEQKALAQSGNNELLIAPSSGSQTNGNELIIQNNQNQSDNAPALNVNNNAAAQAQALAQERAQREERARRDAAEAKAKAEAEAKAKELALKQEAERKAQENAPKLGRNLRDISSSVKLNGREGLASLNNVSISVKGPVSIRVSDSRGKTLVNGTYKAGDRVSATGIPPLNVSVTDTSMVTIRYMGGTIVAPSSKQVSFALPNR